MPEQILPLQNANLGWLYYKKYYNEVNFSLPKDHKKNKEKMEAVNATVTGRKYNATINYFHLVDMETIPLYTTYPGLISGTGYTHETGKEGETKIGFYFDHATGMPCLPGHSVKGALRSKFPQWHSKEKYKKEKQQYMIELLQKNFSVNIRQSMQEYLTQCCIKNFTLPGNDELEKLFIETLENIIFEGKAPLANNKGEWAKESYKYLYKSISIYERDIFHDAYINKGGKGNEFLGMDAITPHPHPLKNPVPLLFIKVLPKVLWVFQFDVKNNLIPAQIKLKLFTELLQTFGIGAKTNVGYGQFQPA